MSNSCVWLVNTICTKRRNFFARSQTCLVKEEHIWIRWKCNFRIFCSNIGSVYEEDYENFLIKIFLWNCYQIEIKWEKKCKICANSKSNSWRKFEFKQWGLVDTIHKMK